MTKQGMKIHVKEFCHLLGFDKSTFQIIEGLPLKNMVWHELTVYIQNLKQQNKLHIGYLEIAYREIRNLQDSYGGQSNYAFCEGQQIK